ncbi:MAG: PIN domain-containing protein [Pseudonocardia sp.]
MTARIVLDAAAFDVLDQPAGTELRALVERSAGRGTDTFCAAVTLTEVCRGTARTRRVEASLVRARGGHRIRVVPIDERLAKLVGAILNDTKRGSEHIADAHVVAVCAGAEQAIVITADPDDIAALAVAMPGVRIVTRKP